MCCVQKGSVAVTMGGIAEMFYSQEHNEEIILRGRCAWCYLCSVVWFRRCSCLLGFPPAMLAKYHADIIILSQTLEIKVLYRKGLIRTAIETGTPVVPCYHLGNSQTLRFGPQWLQPLSRRLRTSVGIVMGCMGTPLPVQVPIIMCVGKRITPGVLFMLSMKLLARK